MREQPIDMTKNDAKTGCSVAFEGVAQTSLLVNFVRNSLRPGKLLSVDAKRPANIGFCIQRDASDPFRWDGADAAVLQTTEAALAAAELRQDLAA